MAEKEVVLTPGTSARCGNLPKPQMISLGGENRPDIDMPGTIPIGREPTPVHDFTSNFITATANANATMHYNVRRQTPCAATEEPDAPFQNPSSGTPPAGMEKSNAPSTWVHQVDRDAVGHGDGEQDAAGGGDMPVHAFQLDPPGPGIGPDDLDPVGLVAEYGGPEALPRPPELPPPTHDLADRLPGPQPEIEFGPRRSPTGDPGHHTVASPPARDLEPGKGSFVKGLVEWRCHDLSRAARSGRRARAAARQSARSLSRSGRCCEWCSHPRRREPRAASPSRHGYRGIPPPRPGAGRGPR